MYQYIDDALHTGAPIVFSRFSVSIIEGKKLPKMDVLGSIDAYCKVHIGESGNESFETQVVKNNKSPKWNETFHCHNPRDNLRTNENIEIIVMDWDKATQDDVVGIITITPADLRSFARHDATPRDFPIQKRHGHSKDKAKGTISIQISMSVDFHDLLEWDHHYLSMSQPEVEKMVSSSVPTIDYVGPIMNQIRHETHQALVSFAFETYGHYASRLVEQFHHDFNLSVTLPHVTKEDLERQLH